MGIKSKMPLKNGEVAQLAVLHDVPDFWLGKWKPPCKKAPEKGKLFVVPRKKVIHIPSIIQ